MICLAIIHLSFSCIFTLENQGSCVSLGTGVTSGLWFDVACSKPMAAVCEKPRVGFTSPPPTPAIPTVSSGAAKCADGSWFPLHGFCYQVGFI